MTSPIIAYLVPLGFIFCWAGGVISWFFAFYYMVKTTRRFNPERRWAKYLPLSLFMPQCFTDEGNFYRVRLLRAFVAFFAFAGGALAIGSIARAM